MTRSEILGALITAYFDVNPPEDMPTLTECMEWYSELRTEEALDGKLGAELEEELIRCLECEFRKMAEDAETEQNPGPAASAAPVEGTEPAEHETETGKQAPPTETKTAHDKAVIGFAPGVVFRGKGSSEKQLIYDRLAAFRRDNGLGCLNDLAKETNGNPDADRIRDMLHGGKAELELWKKVGRAIDNIEKRRETE